MRQGIVTIAGSLMACLAAAPVLAQEASSRNVAVIDGLVTKNRSTTLVLGAYAALEDNSANDNLQMSDLRFDSPGSDVYAQLTYAARGKQSAFAASAATVLRVPAATSPIFMNQQLGLDFQLSRRRAQVHASHHVDYSPYYSLGTMVGSNDSLPFAATAGSSSRVDYALFRRPAYTHDTAADLSRTLTRHSAVSLAYRLRKTDFVGSTSHMQTQSIAGTVSRVLGRNASLRAGYGYQDGNDDVTPRGPRIRGHNLDLGLDYSRPLSFSRRTTIAFSSGSSIITTDGHAHYRATGQAALNQQISRTWAARAFYHRGLQFIAGFSDPFFTNDLSVSGGGRIGRRLALSVSSGFSVGKVGLAADSRAYQTATVGAGLRAIVTRHLAVDTQYSYYHHAFEDGVRVPAGFARGLNRNGVRAGVTFSTAAFR